MLGKSCQCREDTLPHERPSLSEGRGMSKILIRCERGLLEVGAKFGSGVELRSDPEGHVFRTYSVQSNVQFTVSTYLDEVVLRTRKPEPSRAYRLPCSGCMLCTIRLLHHLPSCLYFTPDRCCACRDTIGERQSINFHGRLTLQWPLYVSPGNKRKAPGPCSSGDGTVQYSGVLAGSPDPPDLEGTKSS